MSERSEQLRMKAVEARRENRPNDARQALVEAVALCCDTSDEVDLAKALTGLGQIEKDLRNLDAARRHYEEAVKIYRKKKDTQRLAHTIRHLGDIHRHEGHMDQAEACYIEALNLYRHDEQTRPLDLANAIRGFAILRQDAGKKAEAKSLWEEAQKLYAKVNIQEGVAESSRRIAVLSESA